jgi:hypothetical protein
MLANYVCGSKNNKLFLSKLIFIDTINIFLSFILLFLTKNIMFIYNVPIIIL